MNNERPSAGLSRVILYNDDKTPWFLVIEVLTQVFNLTEEAGGLIANRTHASGQALIGTFPAAVADAFVAAVHERNGLGGDTLKIVVQHSGMTPLEGEVSCALCGTAGLGKPLTFGEGKSAFVCDECMATAASHLSDISKSKSFHFAYEALLWHFSGIRNDEIVSSSREFPGHMRADVQISLESLLSNSTIRFFGLYDQYRYETMTLAGLMRQGQSPTSIAAAQYQDVDTGDDLPVKCLSNGLWLCRHDDVRFAVVLSVHREYGREEGIRVEIAVPIGEDGSLFTQQCFEELEGAVRVSRSYRGRVLSLDVDSDYQGRSRGVTVHKLPVVSRDEVVLPESTLRLLDRNVLQFAANRQSLRDLGQSTRKGILLYGPPGTGKTHTIRYLASNLAGTTTLIITAAQMGLLGQYMSLARLLQPAMVVIEDVDLIARARESMDSPCAESLLNELLNEMDGLKEDSDILFVLTTNRPEQLEMALSGRPGRIDQAIEVPLPNEEGRRKLVRLYGKQLNLDEEIVREAVSRTEGVSAAFIKEMMRRAAQSSISRRGGSEVTLSDLAEALDDMLFTGGKLNISLLGGATGVTRG